MVSLVIVLVLFFRSIIIIHFASSLLSGTLHIATVIAIDLVLPENIIPATHLLAIATPPTSIWFECNVGAVDSVALASFTEESELTMRTITITQC